MAGHAYVLVWLLLLAISTGRAVQTVEDMCASGNIRTQGASLQHEGYPDRTEVGPYCQCNLTASQTVAYRFTVELWTDDGADCRPYIAISSYNTSFLTYHCPVVSGARTQTVWAEAQQTLSVNLVNGVQALATFNITFQVLNGREVQMVCAPLAAAVIPAFIGRIPAQGVSTAQTDPRAGTEAATVAIVFIVLGVCGICLGSFIYVKLRDRRMGRIGSKEKKGSEASLNTHSTVAPGYQDNPGFVLTPPPADRDDSPYGGTSNGPRQSFENQLYNEQGYSPMGKVYDSEPVSDSPISGHGALGPGLRHLTSQSVPPPESNRESLADSNRNSQADSYRNSLPILDPIYADVLGLHPSELPLERVQPAPSHNRIPPESPLQKAPSRESFAPSENGLVTPPRPASPVAYLEPPRAPSPVKEVELVEPPTPVPPEPYRSTAKLLLTPHNSRPVSQQSQPPTHQNTTQPNGYAYSQPSTRPSSQQSIPLSDMNHNLEGRPAYIARPYTPDYPSNPPSRPLSLSYPQEGAPLAVAPPAAIPAELPRTQPYDASQPPSRPDSRLSERPLSRPPSRQYQAPYNGKLTQHPSQASLSQPQRLSQYPSQGSLNELARGPQYSSQGSLGPGIGAAVLLCWMSVHTEDLTDAGTGMGFTYPSPPDTPMSSRPTSVAESERGQPSVAAANSYPDQYYTPPDASPVKRAPLYAVAGETSV